MATRITGTQKALMEKAFGFGRQNIATRPELSQSESFPHDIWEKMGAGGLLAIGIPAQYGGLGNGYLDIVASGRALTAGGRNLGMAASWLMHCLTARYLILGFGDKSQKQAILPRMATGETTLCLAASEPEKGAHPKFMKTLAQKHGGSFVINGQKAFLTNGPLAGMFTVIAVTGQENGQKQFSAFLVPRDTPGLEVLAPMRMEFLRPCPHGGIRLADCRVPETSVLGQAHAAFDAMVKPFREVEDVLMMGPALGAMDCQLELLAQAAPAQENLADDAGLFAALVESLSAMAYEAAFLLDSGPVHPELFSLCLGFQAVSRQAQEVFDKMLAVAGLEHSGVLAAITQDLRRFESIAANVSRIKQKKLGQRVLTREP